MFNYETITQMESNVTDNQNIDKTVKTKTTVFFRLVLLSQTRTTISQDL